MEVWPLHCPVFLEGAHVAIVTCGPGRRPQWRALCPSWNRLAVTRSSSSEELYTNLSSVHHRVLWNELQ